MTDTPEQIAAVASVIRNYACPDATKYAAFEMLNDYADLRESLTKPVSDAQVDDAEIAYGSAYTKWEENHKEAMRAALESYRASLLGETE